MFDRLQSFARKAFESNPSTRVHAHARGVLPDCSDLIGLGDVEATTRFSPPIQPKTIRLNFFGMDVDPVEYLDDSGYYDFARILHCHRGGATVVFNQSHWFVGPVFHVKRALEEVVGCRVGINAYITPPNARGFRNHVDEHDVFVIQISGSKAWTISGVPPYREGRFCLKDWETPQEETVIMNPGDVLYVPEGVAHCARTHGEERSIHLTCGYTPPRWHNLLTSRIELAAANELSLQDRFPPEIAEGSADFQNDVERLGALANGDCKEAAELTLKKFSERTEHRSDPPIAASRRISMTESTVRLRCHEEVTHHIFGGVLKLTHAPSARTMDLLLKHRRKWEWIAQAGSFHPVELPGDGTEEENVKFCEYLHSNGFLQIAGDG